VLRQLAIAPTTQNFIHPKLQIHSNIRILKLINLRLMRPTPSFMSADRNTKLIGLFVLSLLLFTFPLLDLFGREQYVFGLPLLYVYLFVVWLVVIILLRRLFRKQ
jgi:hypothetical protein